MDERYPEVLVKEPAPHGLQPPILLVLDEPLGYQHPDKLVLVKLVVVSKHGAEGEALLEVRREELVGMVQHPQDVQVVIL